LPTHEFVMLLSQDLLAS